MKNFKLIVKWILNISSLLLIFFFIGGLFYFFIVCVKWPPLCLLTVLASLFYCYIIYPVYHRITKGFYWYPVNWNKSFFINVSIVICGLIGCIAFLVKILAG